MILIDSEASILTSANFQFSNYGKEANYDVALLLKGPIATSAFYAYQKAWESRSNSQEEAVTPAFYDIPESKLSGKELGSPMIYVTSKPRKSTASTLFAETKKLRKTRSIILY